MIPFENRSVKPKAKLSKKQQSNLKYNLKEQTETGNKITVLDT